MSRVAHAAVLAACAALAFGCGDDGGAGSDDPLLRTIARAAKADDGLGVRFALRGSMTAFRRTSTTRGYGQFEPARHRGRNVLFIDGERHESFVDGSFVITPPLFFDDVPDGAEWLRIDRHKVTGANRGGPTAAVGVGPAQSLDLIARGGATVRGAGRARVRGVTTRRYRATLPFGRYLDAAVDRLDDPLDCPDAIRDPDVSVTLWIGDDDLLRRARLRLASEDLSIAVTMDVTGYDRGLRVRLPARRTIYDASSTYAKIATEDDVEKERSGEC